MTAVGTARPDFRWVDFANSVLRHRRLWLAVSFVTFVLAAIVVLRRPDNYSSHALFIPQSSPQGGQLASVAAEFGFALPAGDQTRSPAFYSELLRSNSILNNVASAAVPVSGDSTVLLSVLLDVEPGSPGRVRQRTRSELSERLTVSTDVATGMVMFSISLPDPVAAAATARLFLDHVEQFDVNTRQSQAVAQREFVTGRLEELEGELAGAERDLRIFLESNRNFSNSPSLSFQHERLQRRVASTQQNVMTLRQAYEQARIDAVRDMPLITVIDPPEVPVKQDAKFTLPLLAVAALMATLVAVGVTFLYDRASLASSVDPSLEEFRRLRGETAAELRRLLPNNRRKRPGAGSNG